MKSPIKLTIRQQVNRIEKWMGLSVQADKDQGFNWYHRAHDWASDLATDHGISVESVSHVAAILSAQCDWETNKRNTEKFLNGDLSGIFATRKQLMECSKVIDGWRIPAKRRKTHAFASTISDPYLQEYAVIDRHAIKIAFDQLSADTICITDRRYNDAEKAYIIVADRRKMLPSQVQAITWVTYKRITGR